METSDVQAHLVAQAERQTKALENIQSALMLLTVLAVLAAALGLVAFIR